MRIMSARGSVTGFESQVYRKNGDVIWISENARVIVEEDGLPLGYEGTVEDITERQLYQARIEHQANYDTLTGLANRSLLQDRLEQALLTAATSTPAWRWRSSTSTASSSSTTASATSRRRRVAEDHGRPPRFLRARMRHRGAPGRR